jgi:hypothetical protein
MLRPGPLTLVLLALLATPRDAAAVYSAPLTRVRIDSDRSEHTPSLLYLRDSSGGDRSTDTLGYGAQYVFQTEWASGFGLQLTGLLGRADVTVRPEQLGAVEVTGQGLLAGAQLRAYHDLWHGAAGAGRPSALTGFVNLRYARWHASGSVPVGTYRSAELSFSNAVWSAGAGLMAELSLGAHVSVCPYAWFSPVLDRARDLRIPGAVDSRVRGHFDLDRPLRVGLDLWLYPSGLASDGHLALSTIASLVDTSGNGAQELSVVLGYTF